LLLTKAWECKKYLLLIIGAIVSAFLHNAFYGIFKVEEPVFFFLTFVLLGWFLVALIKDLLSTFIKK